MFNSWLSPVNAPTSAEVVEWSGFAASAMWLTGFLTCLVNGRIWFSMGPVVFAKKGCVWRSAGPRAWADGINAWLVGPSTFARVSELVRAVRVERSADGASAIAWRREASWLANAWKTEFEDVTKVASCWSWFA